MIDSRDLAAPRRHRDALDLSELHDHQRRILLRAAKAFGQADVIGVKHVENAYSGKYRQYGFYALLTEEREMFLGNGFEEALVRLAEPDFQIKPSNLSISVRAELLLQRLQPVLRRGPDGTILSPVPHDDERPAKDKPQAFPTGG